jgi:nucleoside-diphosphate-sugar epimerase
LCPFYSIAKTAIMDVKMVAAAMAAVIALLSFYLYRLNQTMLEIPKETWAWYSKPWTETEIQEAFERMSSQPIDFARVLPPKLDRRYVVCGGSGLVGGDIVLNLLSRGQSPSSIRVLDFSKPSRPDMSHGEVAAVDYVKTDVTDPASVETAFAKPWPSDVARLPLTVFHTVATIRPGERSLLLWERTSRVNVDGTRNVLAGAKAAGADIFVATSSASVALRPASFLIAPWQARPKGYFQVCDERDFDRPLRSHGEFFSNYAYSKAIAERDVCSANASGFRTGCIRPGNGIYGQPTDVTCGSMLKQQVVASFTPHIIQHQVAGWNVSLAHLSFEAALARSGTGMPKCAGRPYVVTDTGPAIQWWDFFRAAKQLAVTPMEVTRLPPLPLYLIAHLVEFWSLLLARAPFLTRLGLREPRGLVRDLQPSIFTPAGFIMVVDKEARKSVDDGGIGYTGLCTTLEGVCDQIWRWNQEMEQEGVANGVTRKSILEADIVETHVPA